MSEGNDRDAVESLVSKREIEDESEDYKAKRRKQDEADRDVTFITFSFRILG